MVLTDADRIRGLLGTYCRLIDSGDFAGVGDLMATASLKTEDGATIATGAAEITALYAGLVHLHEDGTPGTQHVVANTVFDEPDPTRSRGAVTARSTYLVFQAVTGLPLQPIITGSYLDTFDTDEHGAWHFVERRFGIGRSGDLAHHLSTEFVAPTPGDLHD